MKANLWTAGLALAGIGALATGCVERQVEYVPVYRVQPAYAGQPATPPPTQPPPNSGTGVAPAAPTANWQQPPPVQPPMQAQAAPPQPAAVVAPSAPPPAQVEVIPAAPGPYFVWTPGYWGWNGGWVWIGGRWVVRPWTSAVWVGGHWGRRGHGYIWIGGRWR